MRVALICPYSLSLPGGVQNQVLGLARALRTRGHTTYVLGPCDGPPPDANVIPLGNSVPTSANGSVAPIAPDFPAALRTVRVLREEKFDVMHLHEPLVPGPTLTALLFADTPSVGTFHRQGMMQRHGYVRMFTRSWAQRLEVRVAVSSTAHEAAESMFGGTYETLFNGVEVERFANAEIRKPDHPTIFFLGRHEERKGLKVLIKAIDFLPEDVRIWIGGVGPETESLMKQTAGDKRLVWLGRLSDHEAASRMASADVFCAPSLAGESFGIVLLEAMAARTPVVASDIPGYNSLATSDMDSLLVPPNDSHALAEALSRVLSNSSFAKGLIVNGVKRAEEFSMEKLAAAYEELYLRARLVAR